MSLFYDFISMKIKFKTYYKSFGLSEDLTILSGLITVVQNQTFDKSCFSNIVQHLKNSFR